MEKEIKRLAIITTHPIQYHAPLFRLLAERGNIELKVFYTWGESEKNVFDRRFGIERSWDIPLLDGYNYEFVPNVARKPGSHHFWGIQNPGLKKKLENWEPDALLVFKWSLQSHLRMMRKFKNKITILFRGDSHLLDEPEGWSFKKIIRRILLQWVYSHVDKALCVGKNNRDYFLAHGLKNEQLIMAPHAIDNKRFAEDNDGMEVKALSARKEIDIPEEAIVFLYAGKFYAVKQLDLLIEAFRELPGEGYRLLLTGAGEQEEYLRKMSVEDERILFMPFHNQSDMPWVYRMGNVFVLPSSSETWGLSINEAMACHRPVIVSNKCGGAVDLVQEGINGFIFGSGDKAALLHCLKSCDNREKLKQMGNQSFGIVQSFSLDKVAGAIEEAVMNG